VLLAELPSLVIADDVLVVSEVAIGKVVVAELVAVGLSGAVVLLLVALALVMIGLASSVHTSTTKAP
jgi:pyridoxine 5'-phosphate synthase PdxJ